MEDDDNGVGAVIAGALFLGAVALIGAAIRGVTKTSDGEAEGSVEKVDADLKLSEVTVEGAVPEKCYECGTSKNPNDECGDCYRYRQDRHTDETTND